MRFGMLHTSFNDVADSVLLSGGDTDTAREYHRNQLLSHPATAQECLPACGGETIMSKTHSEVSLKERLRRLAKLDLTNVRRKLMEPEPEGKGWSETQVLEAELWYKRYLEIILRFPDTTQHVPNGPIDFFWHQHILDTMAYGRDCEYVMGYFLHHYPYFGLNGDTEVRDNSFDVTNELYRKLFGADCTQMQTFHPKVPEDCTLTTDSEEVRAMNCNSSGSGTGCGQGCKRVREIRPITTGKMNNCCQGCSCAPDQPVLLKASNCNSSGSGTGCGQGCSRGCN